MRSYECIIVVAPGVSPETLKESTKWYADVIASQGGTLTKLEEWGKRALAYEIDHHREGHYVFYKFRANHGVLAELNRQLRIDEKVLRHLVVRDDLAAGNEPEFKGESAPSREAPVKEEM